MHRDVEADHVRIDSLAEVAADGLTGLDIPLALDVASLDGFPEFRADQGLDRQ